MRQNFWIVVLVASALGVSIWQVGAAGAQLGAARGQSRAISPAAFEARVALIDIAHVFKSYHKFNRLAEQMKDAVKDRDSELAQLRAELRRLLGQRDQHNPISQTYKSLEENVATKKAQLDLKADSARREFQQREANLYYQTYREVEAAVQQYAASAGFTLVLRTSRNDNVSPTQPQEVIKQVSRPVVFSLPGMDITDVIIEMLNRSGGRTQQFTGPRLPSNTGRPNRSTLKTGRLPQTNQPIRLGKPPGSSNTRQKRIRQ